MRQEGVSFSKLVVEHQRLIEGSLRFRHDFLRRRMSNVAQRSIGKAQHAMREGETVIESDRLLKVGDGFFDVWNPALMYQVAASDVKLPCFGAVGITFRQQFLVRVAQR